ncbi:MAG: hypothetical protein PHX27_01510 [Candidatus ainarchaeum sp.]|nr:hypothetical protein [Candidatus ainarchaeum sp.]
MPLPNLKRKINGTVFRKNVNIAATNVTKTKMDARHSRVIKKGKVLSTDSKKMELQVNAKKELTNQMNKRKTGLKGLTRTILGKTAMKKVLAIKKYNKSNLPKKQLHKIHPILKGIKIKDKIKIHTNQNKIMTGQIIDSVGGAIYIKIGEKTIGLRANSIKTLTKIN